MKSLQTVSILIFAALITSHIGIGCSKVGFSKVAETSESSTASPTSPTPSPTPAPVVPTRDGSTPLDTTVTSCTLAVQQITYPLKFIFVLDASGSNRGSNGTDPARQFRYGTTASFLNKFYGKTNFQWQLIHFQEVTNKPKSFTYITNAAGTPTFSNSTDMNTSLEYFKNNVVDGGYTPYKSALAGARTAITSSSDAANTRYAVIFITDGMPTDYVRYVADPTGLSLVEGPNAQGLYGVVDESALLSDVVGTVAAKSGLVSLSTVFYGTNNSLAAEAKQRLRDMASVGGGKFIDASLDEQIRVEDAIALPGLICTP